jgi:polyphosphate kinase
LDQIEKGLEERQYGNVLRLEVDDDIDNRLLKILKNNLEVMDEDIFRMQGPLDMTFLEKLYDLVPEEFNKYKYPPFSPQIHPRIIPNGDIFAEIRKKDIFLFHPYESFDSVVDFLKQGSEDPTVLAIKITLYKVNSKSPIVEALIKAAENGKQVTILLELKARFDEKNSIKWAKEFEKVGCHVIYGSKELKTHC